MEKTKYIPKIRFKGYKDEWEKKELGELAEINMGQSPNGNSYSLRPIKNGYILIQGNADLKNRQVTPRVWTSEITKMAEANDIIMSVRAPAGIVGKTKYRAVIGRGVAAIKGNEFLYHLLIKMEKTYWQSISTGSTFESIDKKTISNAIITYPSAEEQKQIGSLFKNLDEKLEIEREKHEKLVNFKKAMLENVFPKEGEKRPKIRFGGYNDDWKGLKIKDIGIIKTGKTPPTADRINYTDRGILFITPTDIKNNVTKNTERKLSELGSLKSTVVEPGSILITCIASIGKNTLIEDFSAFNQQINSITPYNCDSYFVYTLSYHWSNYMSKIAATGTMQIINKNDFSEIETFIPSINEQKLIGSFFKNLDEKIQVSEEMIIKIENYKRAMMEAIFV